jgi:hypothetical protein
MIVRVEVLLDDANPEQAATLHRLLGWARDTTPAVPTEFITAVRTTKVGQTIVLPLVTAMVVGQRYTPKAMADLIGRTPLVVGKRLTVLGRTEKRFGGLRIFIRHGEGRDREYSISEEMKRAFSN